MISKRWIISVVLGVLAVGTLFAIFWNRGGQRPEVAQQQAAGDAKTLDSEPSDDWIEVGGVKRPPSDVRLGAGSTDNPPVVGKLPQGFSPALAPDTNPQVAAVFASLQTRDKPSRFSSFAAAEPFDAEAFAKNPDEYLNTVEPSRVFSPAQPGEGVVAIQAKGSRFHRVKQGEVVELSVNAAPGAPITFTSSDLGFFDNKLSSVTVRADENGVARASFTAGGGTIDLVKVLAAGPVTTGQVAFDIHVSVPAE